MQDSHTPLFEEKTLQFLQEILKNPPRNIRVLEERKNAFAKEHGISTLKNRDLVVVAQKNNLEMPEKIAKLIQKRSVRTISGVSPIGILTKPFDCPGKCIYCPTEDRMPKSYMSNQPAAARAVRNHFHPFLQVKNRIISLEESGHPVSKLEVIVMGGTWSFLPTAYQQWYIKKIFEAANSFDEIENENEILEVQNFEPKNLKIFEAQTQQEKQRIFDFFLVTWKNHYSIDLEPIFISRDFFKDKIYYIEKNNKIIAALSFSKLSNIRFLLQEIAVEKDFRGKKIGEYLLQYCEKKILKENISEIVLDADPSVVGFYKSQGYEENFIDWKGEGSFQEDIAMGKKLNFSPENLEIQPTETATLEEIFAEQKINESASHRVIGLTLETRPDWITEKELVKMRNYGCTRIEIGVQTLDDEVQKLTQRGHNRNHVIKAMKLMKDFGFKVCFHLMPGLPGSTPEKDIAWIKEVFEDENFRPDFIKIYPCVVLETAELKKWWEEGKYVPYDDATLIKLLVQLQTVVPEYCRIMRLMRDIPVQNILGGAKFSNLRQILHSQPEKLKEIVGEKFFEEHDLANTPVLFKDIRSKEIGFADEFKIQNSKFKMEEPVLKRRDYNASEGKEVFLSFETQDEQYLFALLRLRKPSENEKNKSVEFFPNALQNAALIREVHSYGTEISIGDESGGSTGQHKGLGKKLLLEAEKIAKEEWGMEKISIIAGVGTREYYRKFGYEECETYMTKFL